MNIYGSDIGFKQFKGVMLDKDIAYKFDNIIGFPSSLEITTTEQHSNVLLSDLSVELGGSLYYVGDKAKHYATNHRYTFLANKTDTIDEKIKLLSALGILHYHDIVNIDLMVTGVPVDEYHMVKDRIQTNLRGAYQFLFRNKPVSSEVKEVAVVPQGAGDYYDYILSPSGEIYDDKILPKTLIVNIGYRTTELVVMNYGKFSRAESTTLYTATQTFHKELLRQIVKEYGTKKTLTQIDDIYKTGLLYHDGVEYDISHLRERSILHHIGTIVGEIPMWVNPSDLHLVIITGGGSKYLLPALAKAFHCQVIHHNEPEYGNARGFYKYGRLLTNEQRHSVPALSKRQ